MKKLFVLFLLVALVPFSVGCSLWGDDDDNEVIDYPYELSLKVVNIDKGLASTFSDYETYSVKLVYGTKEVVLPAVGLETQTNDANIDDTVVFEAKLATDDERAVRTALDTAGNKMTATLYNGNTKFGESVVFYSNGDIGEIKITVSSAGVVSVTVNEKSTDAGVPAGTVGVTTTTGTTLSTTSATPTTLSTTVVDGKDIASITLDPTDEVTAADVKAAFDYQTFNVTVGGIKVDKTDFTYTYNDDGSVNISFDKAKITAAGLTAPYAVVIEYVAAGGKILTNASTYYFKF